MYLGDMKRTRCGNQQTKILIKPSNIWSSGFNQTGLDMNQGKGMFFLIMQPNIQRMANQIYNVYPHVRVCLNSSRIDMDILGMSANIVVLHLTKNLFWQMRTSTKNHRE